MLKRQLIIPLNGKTLAACVVVLMACAFVGLLGLRFMERRYPEVTDRILTRIPHPHVRQWWHALKEMGRRAPSLTTVAPRAAVAPADEPASAPAPEVLVYTGAATPHQLAAGLFAQQIGHWQAIDRATQQPVVRVPLTLVGPAELTPTMNFPLAGGVPLAMGQLQSGAVVRLHDDHGAIWPVQTTPLSTWEDGSVQWLLVNTSMPSNAQGRQLWLEYGVPVRADAVAEPRVSVEQTPDSVTVSTGPLRLRVSKQRFTLFESVAMDRNGNRVMEPDEQLAGGGDLVVRFHDVEYRSSLDTQTYQLTVEESGPLRATLKATGWFRDGTGRGCGQFVVRIQAFAGQTQLRVFHTFIYTGYPANRVAHLDASLPENEAIQEIGLELPLTNTAGAELVTADNRSVLSTPLDAAVTIAQTSANNYQLRKHTNLMRDGMRHEGWCLVQHAGGGVLVGVRDAWQQFPKEWAVDPSAKRLVVKLWPATAGALNLETTAQARGTDDAGLGSAFGLGKTHELVFGFFGGPMEPASARALVAPWLAPWVLAPHPAWLSATGVDGTLGPAQLEKFPEAEHMLDGLFDWAQRQPQDFDWYGMLDYGDTLSWYRKDGYDKKYPDWGWHPEGRWGWHNGEGVGSHGGAWVSFLRTHNLKYFRFAEAKTRHVMDVDTVHYDTVAGDPRLAGKISERFSQVGSMHRHSANHWSGRNDEASHTNVTGLLAYYYLTGDGRARDVLDEVGGFLLRDPVAPAEHDDEASATAIGHVLWGDAQLYAATRDERYRTAAQRWAAIVVHGQRDDGLWTEQYHPKVQRWTGPAKTDATAFPLLPALIAYHQLTGDASAARAIVKATNALMDREPRLFFYDALAYSYLLTGQGSYLDDGVRRLQDMIGAQQRAADPVKHGMVFEQLTYDRVGPVLYGVPFLLGATDAKDFATLEHTLHVEGQGTRDEGQGAGGKGQGMQADPASPVSRPPPPAPPSYEVLVMPSTVKVLPEVPSTLTGAHPGPVRLSLARNEYEAAQLIIHSPAALQRVTVETKDLKQTNGTGVIAGREIGWSPVGFVKTKKPDYDVAHVGLWPDPLPGPVPFDVAANWAQPIWLTVHAPSGTPAGEYAGTVTIHPADGPATEVSLAVTVWDFDLPVTPSLKSAFDVYPNRIRSAYSQFFPQWWAQWEHKPEALEERFTESLMQHRLSPILSADVSDAVKTRPLQKLSARGLSAFAVGRHGGSFDNDWPADATPLALLQPVYRNYAYQLRDAKLLDRHYVYTYDEPAPGLPQAARAARMIHAASPTLKNLVTLNASPDVAKWREWFTDIDIVTLRNVTFDPAQARALQQMGKEVWLYVSGPAPPFPTLVIDYPAMAYRILPWMCWKYQLKGLLYWCVNFWTTNPYLEPMNTKWGQNGNGSLYYPGPDGPVSSIRLEVLRDGMEDYEYLHLLQEQVARVRAKTAVVSDPTMQDVVRQAEQLLTVDASLVTSMRDYTADPQALLDRRAAIAHAIEQLERL